MQMPLDQQSSSSNLNPSFAHNNIPAFQSMPASVARISTGPIVQLENYLDNKPKARSRFVVEAVEHAFQAKAFYFVL